MYKRLIIIGARGHGKVVADIAKCLGEYEEIAFLDDDNDLKESAGIPVIGKSTDWAEYAESNDIFVAIGNTKVRKSFLGQLWEIHAYVPKLVHPHAIVGTDVTVGMGTAIMAGVVINAGTTIGKGCIVNTSASVDHDCMIGDYVHVAVGAHLAGNVRIGADTWVGAGVIVKNNIEICNNCMIGAGAVVIGNLLDAGTYVGVPAREMDMRRNKGRRIRGE